MSQRHLFRFSLENIPETEDTRRIRKCSEELDRADEVLARRFQVHTVPVRFEERRAEGYMEYARDTMVQIGGMTFVKPEISKFLSNLSLTGVLGLLPWVPQIYPFSHSKFEREVRRAGYKGGLIPSQWLSEGGQFVVGNKFCLVSDVYFEDPHNIRTMQRIARLTRKSVYPVHSFTSIAHGHIDCDYGIVDDIGVIYTFLRLGPVLNKPESDNELDIELYKGVVNSRRVLDEIASEHDYKLRWFRINEKSFDLAEDRSWNSSHGINFLTSNGTLFTTSILPKEKRYLQKHGIEVIEIPLRYVTPRAGLRCVYAELNI